ncbi:hypothetical protein [Priestia flexa]|nr:hypothetical protein [Priestia flexa]
MAPRHSFYLGPFSQGSIHKRIWWILLGLFVFLVIVRMIVG